MKRVTRQEMVAALVVGGIGAAILLLGSDYSFGTLRRIGPGFFPLVVGSLLVLFSAGLVIESLRSDAAAVGFSARPFLMIMAAILAFGVLMERAGLIPATFALVTLSALAERPVRPLTILASAAALSVFGILVFVHALGLPLSAFHW